MPQRNAQGIDVSKEEERYLRRAFRRFALPYVVIFAVLAGASAAYVSKGKATSSPEAMSTLQEQLAALQQSVAKLEGRVDRVGSDVEKAGRRVGALEARGPATAPAANTAALEDELRDATRRVVHLEQRVSEEAAAERIDALAARMRRIEETARQTPASPSMPAAPAPLQ